MVSLTNLAHAKLSTKEGYDRVTQISGPVTTQYLAPSSLNNLDPLLFFATRVHEVIPPIYYFFYASR